MTPPDILIVSATLLELKPILGEGDFSEGKCYSKVFKDINIDLLITGVGITAMSYHLTKQLQTKSYNFIISIGIAGSYNTSLTLGEVVMVSSEKFADLGLQQASKFEDLFRMGLMENNQIPFTKGKLKNYTLVNNNTLMALPQVSSNTIHTLRSPIHPEIQSGAEIENMEGAAFFYVCMMEKQAFVQIRAISNYVGETDKRKWNIPLAVERLNTCLVDVLNEIV